MRNGTERKVRSEEICRRENVPINPHLPIIEGESNSSLRSLEEVAWRAIALCLVAMKGEGMPQPQVLEVIDSFELSGKLTPNERMFVYNDRPTAQDLIRFSWRYESYWVLLWSLGYIADLGRPDHTCDVRTAVEILSDNNDPDRFISNAGLLPHSVILDELDLTYRYDWACVEARLRDMDAPGNLNAGVVYERHYSLNWLVGYMNQQWDDVTTDT